MKESTIERFIRVNKEKLAEEAIQLIHDEGILERQRRLGRLEAIAESIAFARTCKNQEPFTPTEAQ